MLDIRFLPCYDVGMDKREDDTQLTQVGVRFGPAPMRQLMHLARFYGGKTRTLTIAVDRMYQAELAGNPAFAEWVADAPPAPADAGVGEGG